MRSLPQVIASPAVVLLTLLGFAAQEGWAQAGEGAFGRGSLTSPDTSIVRVTVGLGAGSLGSDADGGVAARAGVTVSRGRVHSITVRSSVVEEFVLFGPTPPESVWDAGVLFGRQTRGERGYASVAAGLALVGGVRRGERLTPPSQCGGYGLEALGCALGALFTQVEYAEERFHTVGVPVEVEAGVTFTRGFGLGLTAFANVNGERSVAGATLSIVFGRLR